jgi:competence protein ComGF
MMNRLQELESIWADYKFQRKTLKLFKLNVKLAVTGAKGLSASLLEQCGLKGSTVSSAQLLTSKAEQHLADSTILSMWIIFERCLTEYLQKSVAINLLNPKAVEALSNKLEDIIERSREDDKIEIVSSILNSGSSSALSGDLKNIKKYRDWIAHKNPKKPSPSSIKPDSAYTYFKKAIELLA